MIEEREIKYSFQKSEMEILLKRFDLGVPQNYEYALGLYDEGRLVGCGCRKGDSLQGFAVDPGYHGEGLAVRVAGRLIQQAATSGVTHLYMFTKPSMAELIESMGFSVVANASPYAVLLEYGPNNVEAYKKYLTDMAGSLGRSPGGRSSAGEVIAGVVVNCNPFTLGHRYLLEYAARNSDFVYAFVVEEDVSEFPFKDRFQLVREGVSDLENLFVLPGGKYIVSYLTFPSYFTKEENLAHAQSALDAVLFAEVISPALSIKKRYVGSEPMNPVTAIYNETLHKILPPRGVDVEEISRIEKNGRVISASQVRRYLSEGKIAEACKMLPDVTVKYIKARSL